MKDSALRPTDRFGGLKVVEGKALRKEWTNMDKYYLAYGSNLSMAQMAQRCPDAIYVGTAELEDYQLLFKGSQSGSYLTVESKKGSTVPVLVWRISERDEHYLDRYEGYPSFYYKKTMEVEVQSFIGEKTDGITEAIIYIMHEDRPLGCPTKHYYDVCLEGYKRFHFDEAILEKAFTDSVGKRLGKHLLKEVGYFD